MATVGKVHRAGIPLLVGMDSAYVGPLNVSMPYRLTMHCELEFLVSAGLSPVEALGAATKAPVKIQRMGNRGVIAAGKRGSGALEFESVAQYLQYPGHCARVGRRCRVHEHNEESHGFVPGCGDRSYC